MYYRDKVAIGQQSVGRYQIPSKHISYQYILNAIQTGMNNLCRHRRRFQRAGDQSATSNLPASLSYNESTMKRCTHELNREVQAICSGSCCFVWLLRFFRMPNPPIVGSMLLDTCCWLVVRQSSRCSYSDCRSESNLCTYVEEAAMY